MDISTKMVPRRSKICRSRAETMFYLGLCGIGVVFIFQWQGRLLVKVSSSSSSDLFEITNDSPFSTWDAANSTLSSLAASHTSHHLSSTHVSPLVQQTSQSSLVVPQTSYDNRTTIAYAITITKCAFHKKERRGGNKKNNDNCRLFLDAAAVLRHSIRLAHHPSRSDYDAHAIAFVYLNTTEVTEDVRTALQAAGYNHVIAKDVPFDAKEIRGNYKKYVDKGCCGRREWLKLYCYTMMEYPVVIHLDVDAILLQSMDELIDAILKQDVKRILDSTKLPDPGNSKVKTFMWPEDYNDKGDTSVDAFFTRDYNMVAPGRRKVHQIGVQGGFLVVRPNRKVFQQYIHLILEGNFTLGDGWGGPPLQFGGYYGGATIQGLASMMYSHVRPNTGVELNRCMYNNMGDSPYAGDEELTSAKPGDIKCRTMQRLDECEDCRKTPLALVKSIHFTTCFKPWKCVSNSAWKNNIHATQCQIFHREWFRIRQMLENQLHHESRRGHAATPPHSMDDLDDTVLADADQLRSITSRSYGACVLNERGRFEYRLLPLQL